MPRKRQLGGTGLQVTEIGFGALEIGRDWAADVNVDPTHCTQEEATRVLNGLLDAGINFIDTAPAYWSSEDFIGNAIEHRRDEYVLATKVGEHCDRNGSLYDYSYEATLRFIDQSLARLKTDRIDLLQIHSASIEVLERGDTWRAMDEARRAGKVLHIGMTGGVKECVRALEVGGYETVQAPYNLVTLEAEEQLLPLVREKNAGFIIMRSLAGGKLTPKYTRLQDEKLRQRISKLDALAKDAGLEGGLVQLAIGYLLSRPEVSTLIIGSRRLDAVLGNLELSTVQLPADVLAKVGELAREATTATW